MSSLCRPNDALPDANDMDLWLLWTAAEYVLATRDVGILDTRCGSPTAAARRCGSTCGSRSPTRSRCAGRTAGT
jgi:hypothetical protein